MGKSNRELIYGINAVKAALDTNPERITCAWLAKGREDDRRMQRLQADLERCGVRVQQALPHFLDEKTQGGVHQGIIIEVLAEPPRREDFLQELVSREGDQLLLLLLDGVTDPRNLGAAMRCAWAAGAQGVVVPKDHSATLTPEGRKSAAGAASALPLIVVTNLSRTIEGLKEKGVTVAGLAGEAEHSLFDHQFTGPAALVLGAEDKGLRHLTREKCDVLLSIPLSGGAESLNVSVAAGIALYEVVRQRLVRN